MIFLFKRRQPSLYHQNRAILITLLQVYLIDIRATSILVSFFKSTKTLVTHLQLFSLGMARANMWQLSQESDIILPSVV